MAAQYCLDHKIPAVSFSIQWDTNRNRKAYYPPKGWNDITVDTFATHINHTLNGFAVLCGRRTGSERRIVCIDTDDEKAKKASKSFPADFITLLKDTCETIEKTPNGTHYYYLLAENQDDLSSGQNILVNGKKVQFLDLLANGAMAICSPSQYLRPIQQLVKYEFLEGDFSTMTTMPPELYRMLTGKVDVADPVDVEALEQKIAKTLKFFEDCIHALPELVATEFDTWKRVGLFIKYAFQHSEEAGYELWDIFSQKSPQYDSKSVRTFWRSCRPNGTIGEGTILYYIKTYCDEQLYKRLRKEFLALLGNGYKLAKEEFEENHFYCKETQDICGVMKDGRLVHYEASKAKYTFAEFNFVNDKDEMASFIPQWLNDKNKRVVSRIVCCCNEIEVQENEYNIFKGWIGARAKGHNVDGLERCLYLVNILASFDEEKAKYILDWFALLIQKPWVIPRTCLIFISEDEGCGKDTLVDFIGNKLLGQKYYANIGDAAQELYDTHSTAMMGSFLQKLEEANATDNKAKADKLKGLITRTTVNVNEKNVKVFSMNAYPHFCMTTNNTSPVKLSETARRFVTLPVSAKERGNTFFWKQTYKYFDDEGTIAAFYNFLKTRDIATFDSNDFPEDEYLTELKESSVCGIKQFLRQYKETTWLSSTELHSKYREWCYENGREVLNNIAFGRKVAFYKPLNLYRMKHIEGKKHFACLEVEKTE